MADRFTTTSHQGFISRMVNSFVGILVGIVMVPGSVVLVSWNEYRTVHRSRGLAEAEKVTVEVADPFEINAAQNDLLVHTTGTATTEELLSDPQFGVELKAMRLQRKVEMYQWVEHKKTETRDKVGGGTQTTTTYSYDRRWQEGRESSEGFKESGGHENPPLRYASQSSVTSRATLGSFKLNSSLIEKRMSSWKDHPVELQAAVAKLDAAEAQHFKMDGSRLYYSAVLPMASEPQVGDLRIAFQVVEPGEVSVLSKQNNSELSPFKTSNGELIEHLMIGKVSTAEMFNSLKFENTMMAWFIRAGGWILSIVGFSLITSPLQTLASIIPFMGRLVGTMTFFVAFLLGTSLTLTTIAVAWIAVRPLFGIALLALAGGGIYLLTRRTKQNAAPPNQMFGPPPVPPPLPS